MPQETVLVLGASPKPERYAHQAMTMLREYGHDVLLANPRYDEIDGAPCIRDLSTIDTPVDTVTVYVGPPKLRMMLPEILRIAPKRVILNPGTEDDEIIAQLEAAGIAPQRACTLVLLRTGQFDWKAE